MRDNDKEQYDNIISVDSHALARLWFGEHVHNYLSSTIM